MSSYLINGTCVSGPCYSMETLVNGIPIMLIIALTVGIFGLIILILKNCKFCETKQKNPTHKE